ncbi:hypothetical protein SESBI_41397, partial [Sesbania bispinosa]
NCVPVGELCRKWNSMCGSTQKQPYPSDKTITLSSVSPSSSTSGFSYEHPNLHHEWPVAEPKQSQSDHHFWISENGTNQNEPTLRVYIPENKDSTMQPFSSPNHSSNPNSTSSSDVMEMEHMSKFKEFNSENLKTLCNALEEKVPWQREIIPEIVSTILQCRSGMVKRKGKLRINEVKEETWLFFQGVDMEAKEKIARELARLVFGSQSNMVSISLSSFASTRADSTEDYCRNKRTRDEQSCSYIERFAGAVSNNPHRVAIERGRVAVKDSNGEEVGLCDAIIILSCESFSSRSRACSPKQRSCQEQKDDTVNAALEETSPCVSLDLNISIDDDYDEDQTSVDDIGLLESVDRKIVFKIQELKALKLVVFQFHSGNSAAMMVCAENSNLRWQKAVNGALLETVKSRLRTNACSGFAVEWVVACKGGVGEQDAREERWVGDPTAAGRGQVCNSLWARLGWCDNDGRLGTMFEGVKMLQ